MSKFKIGARVRATVEHEGFFWPPNCKQGEVLEGTVVAMMGSRMYTVDFGAGFDGHTGGGVASQRTGWHVDTDVLRLVDPQVAHGERVEARQCINGQPNGYRPVSESELTAGSGAPEGTKQQTDRILAHLLAGHSITQLEAFGVFRIFRLAARIHDLRAKGHKIKTDTKRDATGKTYAEYSLVSRRV